MILLVVNNGLAASYVLARLLLIHFYHYLLYCAYDCFLPRPEIKIQQSLAEYRCLDHLSAWFACPSLESSSNSPFSSLPSDSRSFISQDSSKVGTSPSDSFKI